MRTIGLIAFAMLMACPSALAAQPDATADQASPASPEKRICKKSKATGSLTRVRRICMTQSQWNEEAERAQKSVENIQRNGYRRVGETIDPGAPRL